MLNFKGYQLQFRFVDSRIARSNIIFQEVEKARRERDLAAVELKFQKAEWREANGKFLQLLGSNGDCDIDKLLTDSVSLKKQLDEDSVSVEEEEKPAGLTGSGYKIRAKRVKQLLELEMLPKNEMQRMAVAILEAIEIKVGQYFQVDI